MPADARDAVRAEDVADVVGGAHRHVDELVGAERPGPGHARLDEVAEGVELVAPLQVAVAGPLAGPAEVGVQVAVGLLRGGDPAHDRPVAGVELEVAGAAELPGHRLQQLVDLGVGELAAAPGAGQAAVAGGVEVAEPAGAFQPVLDVRQRGGAVDVLPALPEAGAQGDLPQAERAQQATARRGGCATTLSPAAGGDGLNFVDRHLWITL
nr:hypothetical protein GCM10020092_060950 [Actinoplanes digitatis]